MNLRTNLLAGTLLCLAVAFSLPAISQNKEMSMLYRGRTAVRYPVMYNGTPYWDTTGFKKGKVMYNGLLYDDVLVNIDACAQDLVVRAGENYVISAPDRDQVSWFTKGDRLFVNMRYQGRGDLPAGFYEVLHDGKATVLKQVVKKHMSQPGNFNGPKYIGYDDPHYRQSSLDYFMYEPKYWHISSGVTTRIGTRSDVMKLYKGQKKAMRRAANALGAPHVVGFDRYLKTVMEVVDPSDGKEGVLTSSLEVWRSVPGTGSALQSPSLPLPQVRSSVKTGLPDGYFEMQTDEAASTVNTSGATTASFKNKIYQIGEKMVQTPSKAVITGIVTDADEDKPLEDVTIYDSKTNTYTRTDSRGRYRIVLPTGENELTFSEMTKEEAKLKVQINSSGGFNVVMHEKISQLRGAIITAESMRAHNSPQMGVERVTIKTLNKIPSAFGEGDVLRAVLSLPGVKTMGEAAGGFNVRGGASDQNLILFNEGTIYNPNHIFGILSSFNPDVVSSMELYKSSIPAEYGGRISSVLNVTGKEGDPQRVRGSLGLGLLTSRFHLEGPLAKDKTTFVIGARTTYSDWMLKTIPKESSYANGSADFTDANASITHKPDANNTISLSGYFARDKFAFNGDTTFHYHNFNASMKWQHSFADGTRMAASIAGDRYVNSLDNFINATEAYTLQTAINQGSAKLGFRTPAGSHVISYGVNGILYWMDGGERTPLGAESNVLYDRLDREKGLDASVYVDDTWEINDKLSIEEGIRFGAFVAQNPSKIYMMPELRLSGKYSFAPRLSAKAGFNTLRQNIHLITNTTSISPMDTWKLSSADIKPTDGWQAAGGLYWTVMDGMVDLSAEGYWKNMYNYLDYKSGATLSMNHNLAADLVPVKGKAYGIELMARKSAGRLNGWISYTWSRTFLRETRDRGVNTINGGDWYPAAYDKPHDFKFVGNYAITQRFSFSANVDYSTGRPVTIPVGKYHYGGGYRLLYSARNAYRIPDYFRVDMALNIDAGHHLTKWIHASATIGCYNVTGRKNAYSVYYSTEGGGEVKGYKVSVFATQIPYINLNFIF